ncbi:MAG: sterol desaturase family protein [Elusimicrobia bacterium]|nr:sterol desaturase family protein [Elusimicrobiota bacterium]
MDAKAPAALLAGIVLWPALEYALHRWLGHEAGFETAFKAEHRKHHRDRDYFASAADKLKGIAPAAAALFAVGYGAAGAAAALAFVAGFLGCYLAYEWNHKRYHTSPPSTSLGMKLRKHHFIHHFVDSRSNHGVTTVLFDKAFGTFLSRRQVAIPRAFVPPWMLEPGREDSVGAAYAADFRIAR